MRNVDSGTARAATLGDPLLDSLPSPLEKTVVTCALDSEELQPAGVQFLFCVASPAGDDAVRDVVAPVFRGRDEMVEVTLAIETCPAEGALFFEKGVDAPPFRGRHAWVNEQSQPSPHQVLP